jgi:hypothetical protein
MGIHIPSLPNNLPVNRTKTKKKMNVNESFIIVIIGLCRVVKIVFFIEDKDSRKFKTGCAETK